MNREVIRVEGMMCSHCETAVKEAIMKVPGVKKAKVSKRKKEAQVDFDSASVTVDDIKAAINATGYEAK